MLNGLHNWILVGGKAPLLVLGGWIMLVAVNVGLAIAVSLSGIV